MHNLRQLQLQQLLKTITKKKVGMKRKVRHKNKDPGVLGANYGQLADGPTRRRIKSSRDVGELVVNPIQLIRS